jgi:hypothetical protein
VLPGHVDRDVEFVVIDNKEFVVVEKLRAGAEIAEATAASEG